MLKISSFRALLRASVWLCVRKFAALWNIRQPTIDIRAYDSLYNDLHFLMQVKLLNNDFLSREVDSHHELGIHYFITICLQSFPWISAAKTIILRYIWPRYVNNFLYNANQRFHCITLHAKGNMFTVCGQLRRRWRASPASR